MERIKDFNSWPLTLRIVATPFIIVGWLLLIVPALFIFLPIAFLLDGLFHCATPYGGWGSLHNHRKCSKCKGYPNTHNEIVGRMYDGP